MISLFVLEIFPGSAFRFINTGKHEMLMNAYHCKERKTVLLFRAITIFMPDK